DSAPFSYSQSIGTHSHSHRREKTFHFDHVLGPQDDQGTVYRVTGEPLVQDLLAGYNGCIMTYGQTGAGKTHTISHLQPGRLGLIPRCCHEMFDGITQSKGRYEWRVHVSYLQIYMEIISDLLSNSTGLNLRETAQGGVYVEDLTSYECKTVNDVMSIMRQGEQAKKMAHTSMNTRSSRSHTVLTVSVTRSLRMPSEQTDTDHAQDGTDPDAHDERRLLRGSLVFVDLAGSERAAKTHPEGIQLAEAKSINKSLSCLGNVIAALSNDKKGDDAPDTPRADKGERERQGQGERGQVFVPWRDSKLTRLLQDVLGGNSRNTLIINIGPGNRNIHETVTSLTFGRRAMSVLVHPKVNEEMDYRQLSMELQRQLDRMSMQSMRRGPDSDLLADYESLRVQNESLRRELEQERERASNCETGWHAQKRRADQLETASQMMLTAVNESHERIEELEQIKELLERNVADERRERGGGGGRGSAPPPGPSPSDDMSTHADLDELMSTAEARGETEVLQALQQMQQSMAVSGRDRPSPSAQDRERERDRDYQPRGDGLGGARRLALERTIVDLQDALVISNSEKTKSERETAAMAQHAAEIQDQLGQTEKGNSLLQENLELVTQDRDVKERQLAQVMRRLEILSRHYRRMACSTMQLGKHMVLLSSTGVLGCDKTVTDNVAIISRLLETHDVLDTSSADIRGMVDADSALAQPLAIARLGREEGEGEGEGEGESDTDEETSDSESELVQVSPEESQSTADLTQSLKNRLESPPKPKAKTLTSGYVDALRPDSGSTKQFIGSPFEVAMMFPSAQNNVIRACIMLFPFLSAGLMRRDTTIDRLLSSGMLHGTVPQVSVNTSPEALWRRIVRRGADVCAFRPPSNGVNATLIRDITLHMSGKAGEKAEERRMQREGSLLPMTRGTRNMGLGARPRGLNRAEELFPGVLFPDPDKERERERPLSSRPNRPHGMNSLSLSTSHGMHGMNSKHSMSMVGSMGPSSMTSPRPMHPHNASLVSLTQGMQHSISRSLLAPTNPSVSRAGLSGLIDAALSAEEPASQLSLSHSSFRSRQSTANLAKGVGIATALRSQGAKDDLQSVLAELARQRVESEQRLASAEGQVKSLRQQLSQTQTESTDATQMGTSLSMQLAQASADITRLEKEVSDAKTREAALTQELLEQAQEREKLDHVVKGLEEREASAVSALTDVKKSLSDVQARLSVLENGDRVALAAAHQSLSHHRSHRLIEKAETCAAALSALVPVLATRGGRGRDRAGSAGSSTHAPGDTPLSLETGALGQGGTHETGTGSPFTAVVSDPHSTHDPYSTEAGYDHDPSPSPAPSPRGKGSLLDQIAEVRAKLNRERARREQEREEPGLMMSMSVVDLQAQADREGQMGWQRGREREREREREGGSRESSFSLEGADTGDQQL
ncbi:kinesin-like protein, partial [Kipferlia bialata]